MRSIASLALFMFVISEAGAQPETAPQPHPSLNQLVKEYKRFGLPMPPPNAKLDLVVLGRYQEEPRAPRYRFAYRVPSAKPGEYPLYLTVRYFGSGLEELEYFQSVSVTVTEIDSNIGLLGHVFLDGAEWLTLAIQCKDRGWDELATALYSRARKELAENREHVLVMREVLDIATAFWKLSLTTRGTDRREALKRLKALAVEDEELQTPDAQKMLRSLELTVAPRKSKPGTVESLIDDLTEYWDAPNWSFFPISPEPSSYWKLVELGFDAVPNLIEHIGDERLTRAWVLEPFLQSHSLTVGELCSRILFHLSAQTIGGNYAEAYGGNLHPAEARKWFERAKKVGEERWLLDHAIPQFTNKPIEYHEDRPVVAGKGFVSYESQSEPHIIRVLGVKYPDRLPNVYRTMLGKSPGGYLLNDYVKELVESKLSRDQKIALLEEGAASKDWAHWVPALEGLAKLDQDRLRRHLQTALRRIWLGLWLGQEVPEDAHRLVLLTEAAGDRGSWDSLATAARAASVEDRMRIIRAITPWRPPHLADPHRLERVRFLVQFLDDQTAEIDGDGKSTEVRDYAASQLAGLVGFQVERESDFYRPVYDADRGPLARLVFRVMVTQAATQELEQK
jgi:hypothetical protein